MQVYQENVYAAGSAFHSFKKVLAELGAPYSTEVELASFMSASKGYAGECGARGGYVEFVNMDAQVFAHFKKSISSRGCPTVFGQIALDCVVKPPARGEPSYELWNKVQTYD
jgi:alanine transaminase